MKKHLDLSYDIDSKNMIDIDESLETDKFKIATAEFFVSAKKKRSKKTLRYDGKQIFKMNDGKFILEVEDEEGDVDYFYSNDIKDLLK